MEKQFETINASLKHIPIQQEERIAVIDILRGFALLGILIANMVHFSTPIIYLQLTELNIWTDLWDRWVQGTNTILVEGKFYTLFSFLFGLGFIFFIDRAKEKIARPRLLFFKRLFVLFCFGIIHAYLIWYGDILMLYSVSGLLLLLFYYRKPRTLLIWAILFVFISIGPMILMVLGAVYMESIHEGSWTEANQPFIEEMVGRIESSYYAYGQGTFAELMNQRVVDVHFMLSYAIFTILIILPMFLLGAYTGKKKMFQRVQEHLPFIKKVWLVSLLLGLSLNLLKYYSLQKMDINLPSMHDVYAHLGMVIGDPALSIFYMTSIVLLVQKKVWLSRFTLLAPVGRMALSNYLLQSMVCTTIFYSYGFGLYGKVGLALSLLLAILIFSVQVILSQFWLKRYRFGPMEWVWRRLTYGSFTRNR